MTEMLTDSQLELIFTKVREGSGLRDAVHFVAGVNLTDQLRDWLIERGHHETYEQAKQEAKKVKE